MSMQIEHDRIVKEEFSKQAHGFENKQLSLNSESLLAWIRDQLSLQADMAVLDVAAGTGILSRALAEYVKHVTAIDLSPEMMATGISLNAKGHISNIDVQVAHAEHLPFEDRVFDLVISRLAFHHFTDPDKVLFEMERVSKNQVCVVDMISPEDFRLSRLYNQYEKRRDPSHTYALKPSELEDLFQKVGLKLVALETVEVPVNVNRWLELTKTDQKTAEQIIRDLENELETKIEATGLFPFMQNGDLMFLQTWMTIVGEKRK